MPTPIAPELLAAGRDLTEPRPSPDGRRVAFAVRWGSSAGIAVVPTTGGPERLVTGHPAPATGRGFGGGCFAWLPDGSAIAYAGTDGALWLQRIDGSAAARVAEHDHGPVSSPQVAPDGSFVVYEVGQAEIWRAALDGTGPPVRLDDGRADFCLDPWIGPSGRDVRWLAWDVPDMPWDGARVDGIDLGDGSRWSRSGTGAIQQPRTDGDGRALEVRDDDGWLNVWLDGSPLVAEPVEHAGPTWGPGQRSFAPSPDGRFVAFTRNEGGFGRLCLLDRASGEVTNLGRGVHGQLGWARDALVALRSGARTPTQVVAYRRRAGATTWNAVELERTVLAVGPALAWDELDLPEPEPLGVGVDGDDVTLHARRYVAGRGHTICWIHGGPTDQWPVEHLPRVALWWSRGWDVLVVDPRGTTGHGRAHQQALHGGWGDLDVSDTAAILRASHASGLSTPARTVVMGGSSGGLTVLGVLARHADLVAAGVVSYPVTDLADLLTTTHRFEAHYPLSLVGPPGDVRYRDRSPVEYAGDIDAPLLVLHGDADPVVPIEQSRRLVERIRVARGPDADVVLHEFAGEGHGFRDPANKATEHRLVAEFLERVVGDPLASRQ